MRSAVSQMESHLSPPIRRRPSSPLAHFSRREYFHLFLILKSPIFECYFVDVLILIMRKNMQEELMEIIG